MAYQHWSPEQILNLIEVYRSQECLWKISSDDYGDREKKDRAWDMIAKCVGADVRSVERKIKTLKTQFANYHKLALKKANERGDGFKKPKWFAYGSLEFLLDNRAHKNTDSLLKDECQVRLSRDDGDTPVVAAVAGQAWDAPPLQHEMECTDGDHDSEVMETGYCTPVETPALRTDFNCQFGNLLKDVLNFAKSLQQSNTRDECSIFGEHIACRLRKITDPRKRLLAQNRIHSVLFDLEIGKNHAQDCVTGARIPRKTQLNAPDSPTVHNDQDGTEQASPIEASDELLVNPQQESDCGEVNSSVSTKFISDAAAEQQLTSKKQPESSTAQETPLDAPAENVLETLQ